MFVSSPRPSPQRLTLLCVLFVTGACRTATLPLDSAESYEDVPYEVPGITATAPDFDPDAMSSAILTAIDSAKKITGEPVFTAYNAVMAEASRVRAEETQKRPNELLEAQHGEWMDTRAAGTTGSADPHLEAVAAGHWAAHP